MASLFSLGAMVGPNPSLTRINTSTKRGRLPDTHLRATQHVVTSQDIDISSGRAVWPGYTSGGRPRDPLRIGDPPMVSET
jgi:hypothetical protein